MEISSSSEPDKYIAKNFLLNGNWYVRAKIVRIPVDRQTPETFTKKGASSFEDESNHYHNSGQQGNILADNRILPVLNCTNEAISS